MLLNRQSHNKGYLSIPLNELEIFILSDGFFGLDSLQPILAPDIEPALVQKELKQLYLPESQYIAPISVMLIKKEDRLILADTGEGYHDTKNAGQLLYSLAAAGFEPGDITDILITHAHRDHIGGILSKEGALIYPNARYHISRQELEFWMDDFPDFSNSRKPAMGQSGAKLVKDILTAIREELLVFEPGTELFSCVKTEAAPGHTPGHIVFTVYSGDQSITHLVDVVHSSLLIAQPEWGTQWDVNFEIGVATRKRLLNTCHQNRTLVASSHLPWPGIGYIDKCMDKWQWIPKPYYAPSAVEL